MTSEIERKAFEAWAPVTTALLPNGHDYISPTARLCWETWQAGAAWQRTQSAALFGGDERQHIICVCPDCLAEAQRTQAAGVPEGYVLVPVEPTPEMLKSCRGYGISDPRVMEMAWSRMLAAAPAQPAAQDQGEVRASEHELLEAPQEAMTFIDCRACDSGILIASPQRRTTQQDQGEVQRLREAVGSVVSAGNGLSNIAYNLAQLEGVPLSHYTCELMRMQREQWDKAVAALAASTGQGGEAVSRIKKPRCPACNQRDCKGWQPGDPVHEYRGKGSWFLGCHCEGCSRARAESGGFFGALADALSSTAHQQQEGE